MIGGYRRCPENAMFLRNAGHLVLALSVTAIPVPSQEREPDLKTVLRRAGDYASEYHRQLSTMVAEEWYVQRSGPDLPTPFLVPRGRVEKRERVLKSDFAIVHDGGLWLGVREVFEIDGEAVAGERGRLQKVLSDSSLSVAARVRAIADQQARHNLGDLYRTINVPTLALGFLLPDRQPRFRFKRSGSTDVRGTPVWIVTFQEREHPTLIRTPEGRDLMSNGTFWIDPRTGAALRSELRTGDKKRLSSIILVGYRHHDRFDMLLPDDMNELYITHRERIEGHATYSNFRRFEVETKIK
jgi:hypothetical protein